MSQLNFNVAGDHGTDQPELVTDSQYRTGGVFEGAGRFVVVVPETVTGGATLYYQGRTKTTRVIVPPGPGSWEAGAPPCQPPELPPVLLVYSAVLPRLQADGTQFVVTGRPWTWAMMTGFCDYQKFLNGEDLMPQLSQARDLGSHGRRVFGMMAYITHFDPRSYGAAYYDRLPEFAALLARFGQRLEFCVYADNQVFGFSQDHFNRVVSVLRPLESVVIDAGNEWPKNGFDPYSLAHPGVLSSQGSSTADSAPPMPGWGIRMWHGRRDDKVWLSADDMWFVGVGMDEQRGVYAPQMPVVHEEPMGFAEVDVAGRRSTNPHLAQSLMLTGRGYGAGATFHSEDGIYSRLLGPRQQTCARAFFDAQG